MDVSASQIDRLGKRLAAGEETEGDLEQLAAFRRAFRPAFDRIYGSVRDSGYEPSGRFGKTNPSVVAKLRREQTRLSKMQDIAGVRIVVSDLAAQDAAVARLAQLAPCVVKDRRIEPKYGYRAVHIIFDVESYAVELQIRTALQQRFAEIAEKLADFDPEIKYGGGRHDLQLLLEALSIPMVALERPELEDERLREFLQRALEAVASAADKITGEERP